MRAGSVAVGSVLRGPIAPAGSCCVLVCVVAPSCGAGESSSVLSPASGSPCPAKSRRAGTSRFGPPA